MLKKMTFSTKKLARRPEILHSAKVGLGASNYIKENKLSLFEGDCLKIMPSMEEKSIDLILCDLPYGITRNK